MLVWSVVRGTLKVARLGVLRSPPAKRICRVVVSTIRIFGWGVGRALV